MSEEILNENTENEMSREDVEKEYFAKIAEGRKDDPGLLMYG